MVSFGSDRFVVADQLISSSPRHFAANSAEYAGVDLTPFSHKHSENPLRTY